MKPFALILTMAFLLAGFLSHAQSGSPDMAFQQEKITEGQGITVMWSSADPEIFNNCVAPFCRGSSNQKQYKNVTLFIWGPAIRELADNKQLQSRVVDLMSNGVDVKACQSACENYHATEEIAPLGVEVQNIRKEIARNLEGDVSQLITL
ncbi:MAG: hypothetical protein KGY60_10920 [Bacteroidales bacterium]|nr:hypothetical protein [Bacteroidales bacterium]